jgi:hypothetical protein
MAIVMAIARATPNNSRDILLFLACHSTTIQHSSTGHGRSSRRITRCASLGDVLNAGSFNLRNADYTSKWMPRDGPCRRIAERNFPQTTSGRITSGSRVIRLQFGNSGLQSHNRRFWRAVLGLDGTIMPTGVGISRGLCQQRMLSRSVPEA